MASARELLTMLAGLEEPAGLELRFHADGDHWTLDDNGATMTDNSGYCG